MEVCKAPGVSGENGYFLQQLCLVQGKLRRWIFSGNVDYETKTLFRKDGVLELLEEVKNPINLYDNF